MVPLRQFLHLFFVTRALPRIHGVSVPIVSFSGTLGDAFLLVSGGIVYDRLLGADALSGSGDCIYIFFYIEKICMAVVSLTYCLV
ncbi:hypothetical protein GBA52_013738 [Prunus armeniaca]|nr:hypothetical protein GBA52_013738 [Prunus armeniaca]